MFLLSPWAGRNTFTNISGYNQKVVKYLKSRKERSSGVAAISIRFEKNCSSSLARLQYKRKDYNSTMRLTYFE